MTLDSVHLVIAPDARVPSGQAGTKVNVSPFPVCHPTPREEATCWAGSLVSPPRAMPQVVTVSRRPRLQQAVSPQHGLHTPRAPMAWPVPPLPSPWGWLRCPTSLSLRPRGMTEQSDLRSTP